VNGNLTKSTAEPLNPATKNHLADAVANHSLVIAQLEAVAVTLVLSILMTVVIAYLLKFTLGLRPTAEVETAGLGISEYNEDGYIL